MPGDEEAEGADGDVKRKSKMTKRRGRRGQKDPTPPTLQPGDLLMVLGVVADVVLLHPEKPDPLKNTFFTDLAVFAARGLDGLSTYYENAAKRSEDRTAPCHGCGRSHALSRPCPPRDDF